VRDTEAWEYDAAIGDRTAGILYLAGTGSRPRLTEVVRVAHAAGLPVLVDAAAELPPQANLRRFIEEGADLVVFSGGKAIGGPSASGILCGRRDLVGAALLQQLDLDYVSEDWQPPAPLLDKSRLRGVPRHGIGRACKVGKEQIVGLLVALERFSQDDDAARNQRFADICAALVAPLSALPLDVRIVADAAHGGLPRVAVSAADATSVEHPAQPSAHELAARLRAARPAVHVDATDADRGVLLLVPTCLTIADAAPIAAAFAAALHAPG
jgi:L-seryl-tRNA(Ser) seleniumtransferase